MPEFGGRFFKTFQTVAVYENALLRHGQYVRWTRAILCPCLQQETQQPDPSCSLCQGRGRIYTVPGNFQIRWENSKHDNFGRIYPKKSTYIPGTMTVFHQSTQLTLDSVQPVDNSYVQLAQPWPLLWNRLHISYECTPLKYVTGENCTVIAPNILRASGCNIVTSGDSVRSAGTYTGSLAAVTRVRNDTKDELYTVSKCEKDYIYLSGMGNWESGDTLEVDYSYVDPYSFLISGVSPKVRYNQPYVMDEASAILVTPYFFKPGPNDLFTALSQKHQGEAIIDPVQSGPTGLDVVTNYFDLVQLLSVIDSQGTKYTPGTNLTLVGRNSIQWLTTKPTRKYTVQFMYNPTYVSMQDFPTMRNAENKELVNRINLKQYDQLSAIRSF